MTGTEQSPADTLERVAVLLEAGLPPVSAWRHVAETGARGPASLMAEALARGEPGGAALAAASGGRPARPRRPGQDPATPWRQAAAAWQVAEESGAPLAASLTSIADALRSLEQARRDAEVALAGPIMTARIVLALPVLGLLLGSALGFDSLGVLLLRPVGWILLAAAAALVVAARAWSRRLVDRARPSDAVPGLGLELMAVALSGGGTWSPARERVERALASHCPGGSDRVDAGSGSELDGIRLLSEQAGVPAAGLLRSAAERDRREARARAAVATERLAVTLMLPLGACILPAFVLVAVVPMVIALLSSTGVGF